MFSTAILNTLQEQNGHGYIPSFIGIRPVVTPALCVFADVLFTLQFIQYFALLVLEVH